MGMYDDTDEKKPEYCFICGIKLKDSMINNLIYPPYEFKEGKACFGCGKRRMVQNRNKNIKK